MAGLFDGLESLGFSGLEKIDLFKKEEKNKKKHVQTNIIQPEDYLLGRKYECACCDKPFENIYVRTTRIKLVRTDTDLRPYYEPYDPLHYDAVVCPMCGYASMTSTFKNLTEKQAELILTKITPNYKPVTYPLVYTLDTSIERAKLALLNTVVKEAKASEKAYLCLKLGWLMRDKNDTESEKLYLNHALEGFKEAYEKERFPIFGMDDLTICYLMGELCRRLGLLDEAGRYIGQVVVSRDVSSRLKTRAMEVKELLREDKLKRGAK